MQQGIIQVTIHAVKLIDVIRLTIIIPRSNSSSSFCVGRQSKTFGCIIVIIRWECHSSVKHRGTARRCFRAVTSACCSLQGEYILLEARDVRYLVKFKPDILPSSRETLRFQLFPAFDIATAVSVRAGSSGCSSTRLSVALLEMT